MILTYSDICIEIYYSDIDICQLLVAGWWFSPDTLVSSTNKTDHHDIAEILLKVALNTLTLTLNPAIDIIPKSTFSETMINSNLLNNSKTTFILY